MSDTAATSLRPIRARHISRAIRPGPTAARHLSAILPLSPPHPVAGPRGPQPARAARTSPAAARVPGRHRTPPPRLFAVRRLHPPAAIAGRRHLPPPGAALHRHRRPPSSGAASRRPRRFTADRRRRAPPSPPPAPASPHPGLFLLVRPPPRLLRRGLRRSLKSARHRNPSRPYPPQIGIRSTTSPIQTAPRRPDLFVPV